MERGKMQSTTGSRGNASRKLGASSYLLELPPEVQQQGNSANFRHANRSQVEGFASSYNMGGKMDDARGMGHQDSLSHQFHWGNRDEHRPISTSSMASSVLSKSRLSRSKKRGAELSGSDILTKDGIIIVDSPSSPGIPIVYRSAEMRAANPDRLNLNMRQLPVLPILEGEEKLRMLNLQHNSIPQLQNLASLRRLVFLDMYDNLVQEITGLDNLASLRVLMLGRNRIHRISGLQCLARLDVLDLHGNMITEIEGLQGLLHLRILNMAGNDITCVSGLAHLRSLEEINLRRNRVTNVYEVNELPNLIRLFLSHNRIQSFEDAPAICRCESLKELTLDGNPLSHSTDYRHLVISHVSNLSFLDQVEVSDKEKAVAVALARKEEEQKRERQRQELLQEHKTAAIAAIKASWENAHNFVSPSMSSISSPMLSADPSPTTPTTTTETAKDDRGVSLISVSLPHIFTEATPPYFLDYSDETLHLYGWGALEGAEVCQPVHTKQSILHLHFHYIEFEDIAQCLLKLLLLCPKVTNLSFDSTNICSLEQMNALAQMTTPLDNLVVTPNGNPVTSHPLFFSYTIYRLHHLNLSFLNEEPVEDGNMVEAEHLFKDLSECTSHHLSKARLLTLIAKHRPRMPKKLVASQQTSSKSVPSCVEPVNRLGLHHYSTTPQPLSVGQQDRVVASRMFTSDLLQSTLLCYEKVRVLEEGWPKVMRKLIQEAMEEYKNMDDNMATLLQQL